MSRRSVARVWTLPPASVLGLTLAVALLAACGEATPEERLAEAGETLDEARDEAQEARAVLDAARERLDAAESELVEARRELRAAEKRVLTARERIERRATDVALFRRIQGRLLEDERLRQDAVTVQVDDGRVTLEGSVEGAGARDRAIEIARSTAGVASVRDRLELESE